MTEELRGREAERREEMGEIIRRDLDIREYWVGANLLSPIQQVRVSIQPEITLMRGLSNPIRQVVALISHIRSYPLHCSHLHHPSLSLSSTTLPSSQNTKLSHPSLSHHALIISWHRVQAYTKYNIHWVHHTPTTVSTQYCLSSLYCHDCELTPECSFSFRHASLHDRLPSASLPWELKGEVTLSHSHVCEWTN